MIKILFVLFFSSIAFGDAVIFSGNDVKALKYNLDMFGRSKLMALDSDPTSGGVVAPLASIGMNYLTGKVYVKTGVGNTAWSEGRVGLVNLATDVTGVLPLINGGTNKAMTASNGSVIYSDADSFEMSAVGTSGQALVSGGAGAPTWFAPTLGSVLFAGASGALTQDNSNLFWDNTNKRLGVSKTTPVAKIDVYQSGNATPHIQATDTGAQGATAGGLIQIQADSGAAMVSGNRLGSIRFAGATNSSGNTYAGASITSMAAQNFSGTNGGSELLFNVTTNNTNTRVQSLKINNDRTLQFNAYGTGILKSDSSGNITSSAVDLSTANVTGVLPLANGGTNKNATAVNGGIVYSDADSFEILPAGTLGQLLVSGGAGAPTWFAPTSLVWGLSGNSGTSPSTQYIGTSDSVDFVLRTNATERARWLAATGFMGLGSGISVPAVNLHINRGNGVTAYTKWTAGTTTGILALDGFDVGVSSAGVAQLIQHENLNLTIATNGAANQRVRVTNTGSVVVGNNTSALATNATDGFLYVSTSAGIPTGVPTAQTGSLPIHIDSTNNKLYFYSGGWLNAKSGVSTIAEGGTNNGSLAVTAGGVIYTDGSKLVNTGAGTSGQILQSNGSGAPTWVTNSASAWLVASALVTSSGVVSNESIDFLNGNCTSTSAYTCTFNTSFWSATPNCWGTPRRIGGLNRTINIYNESTTDVTIATATANSTSSTLVDEAFTLICQGPR